MTNQPAEMGPHWPRSCPTVPQTQGRYRDDTQVQPRVQIIRKIHGDEASPRSGQEVIGRSGSGLATITRVRHSPVIATWVHSDKVGQGGKSACRSESRSMVSMSRHSYDRVQDKYSYNITQAKAEGPGLNLTVAHEQGVCIEASGEVGQG